MELETGLLSEIRGEEELYTGEIDPFMVDATQNYPEPHFLVFKDGVGTLPLGDITTLSAKAKKGKSYGASILESVVLGGAREFGLNTEENKALVLHFDTEQSKSNCSRMQRRVHRLMGWDVTKNYLRFQFFQLREMPLEERKNYIEQKVFEQAPSLVIIDGIADLIANFNDIEESNKIIETLLKLASSANCAILTILHENKGKDDTGMKGHLGTLLLQKSASVFHLTKSGGVVSVDNTDSRNRPLETWTFSINDEGMPVPCTSLSEIKTENQLEEIRTILRKVFSSGFSFGMNDLVRCYALESAQSESTAKRRIKVAKDNGLLEVTDGKYKYSN